MFKKATILILVLALVAFLLPATAQAKNTKYTFNDVEIGEQVVEIEASVKDNKKSDYTTCNYYSKDYAEFLGTFQDDVFAGDTAEEVLDYCVANF